MIFEKLSVHGAFLIAPKRHEDERGFFARTQDRRAFEERGLTGDFVQCSISYSRKKGTLRGMHYQVPPYEEVKMVRCTSGRIYDVTIDLRPDSPTFREHVGVELTADNPNALYVPEGCAQGFLTLEDDTEVFYQISEYYAPEATRGVRYDDPAFGVEWPAPVEVIKDRDANFPDFEAARHTTRQNSEAHSQSRSTVLSRGQRKNRFGYRGKLFSMQRASEPSVPVLEGFSPPSRSHQCECW